jgi:hypothetical protein
MFSVPSTRVHWYSAPKARPWLYCLWTPICSEFIVLWKMGTMS